MNIHLDQPTLTTGAPLKRCRAAALLLHGRGRAPDEMIALAEQLNLSDVAFVAPAAAGNSWYPYRFLEPVEHNQPYLAYALEMVHTRVIELQAHGVPLRRIVLIGFSQGACLAAEYAARHAARYGGIILFTGGLIGSQGTTWEYPGDFDGTPMLVGGAEADGWVPLWRMHESVGVFRHMGARVQTHFYPGDSHLVSGAEIAAARAIVHAVVAEAE